MVKMPLVRLLISSFVLPVLITTTWDIAVITKEEVEFFRDGVSVGVGHGYLKELAVGAYDPVHGHLYISDSDHPNTSIFRVDVQQFKDVDSSGFYFEPIASKQSSVQGIAFDPIDSTLFWTTGSGNTILKYKVPPPLSETWNESKPTMLQHPGTVLHQFDDGSVPRGITVDSCSQTLYWTNIKPLGASIERSKTDGSQRKVLMPQQDNEHVKIFQPYGIIVDQHARQLYWCDAIEGSSYQIVRSDLDGSNPIIVISHFGQEPYGLTIAGDRLYWTDSHQGNLYSLAKNSINTTEPKLMKKFGRPRRPDGVVSNVLYMKLKTEECPAVAPILPQIKQLYESESQSTSHFKGNTTNCSTKANPCLNNGRLNQEVCECKVGFSGARCERAACHNFCLNGSCDIDEDGKPSCKCNQGWSGFRCETDKCHDVCSNDGQCSIDGHGEPMCQCAFGYSGRRCEFESKVGESLCRVYCEVEQTFLSTGTSLTTVLEFRNVIHSLEQLSLPVCSCPSETQSSSSATNNYESLNDDALDDNLHYEEPKTNILIIVILGVVCALLGGLAVLLLIKVLKLRKRPRIRKRIVVNRPSSAPSFCNPLAAREQCEITIENCCNMNICETPCFEPEFRSSKPTFNKKKSEDRTNLISAMYSNSNINLSDENQ